MDTEALVKALTAKKEEGEEESVTGTLRIGGASLEFVQLSFRPRIHPDSCPSTASRIPNRCRTTMVRKTSVVLYQQPANTSLLYRSFVYPPECLGDAPLLRGVDPILRHGDRPTHPEYSSSPRGKGGVQCFPWEGGMNTGCLMWLFRCVAGYATSLSIGADLHFYPRFNKNMLTD